MTNEPLICPYCEQMSLQPAEWEDGGETWQGTGDKFGWTCWACHNTLSETKLARILGISKKELAKRSGNL